MHLRLGRYQNMARRARGIRQPRETEPKLLGYSRNRLRPSDWSGSCRDTANPIACSSKGKDRPMNPTTTNQCLPAKPKGFPRFQPRHRSSRVRDGRSRKKPRGKNSRTNPTAANPPERSCGPDSTKANKLRSKLRGWQGGYRPSRHRKWNRMTHRKRPR